MKKLLSIMLCLVLLTAVIPPAAAIEETPNFANLVFFVTFEADAAYDAEEWAKVKAEFDDSSSKNSGIDDSFKAYIYAISDGQLRVDNIFPQQDGTTLTLLTLTGAISDYDFGDDIVSEVVEAMKATVPSTTLLDHDGNGTIDNLTIIVDNGKNATEIGDALYPHKATASSPNYIINGKRVFNYNVIDIYTILDAFQKQGVISHEFLHSLGLPDLYRYDGGGSPVGSWDLMSSVSSYQQYPLTYMRSQLGWLTLGTITETTENVTLDLATLKSGDRGYIIKTPMSDSEFFVVEYRTPAESDLASIGFDTKVPDSGLVIYRVNNAVTAHTNSQGGNYIYVFRKGETDINSNGSTLASLLQTSALTPSKGETSYGSADMDAPFTDNTIFYSDGRNSGIVIDNVEAADDGLSLTFDITMPNYDAMHLWSKLGGDFGTNCTSVTMDIASDGTAYACWTEDTTVKLSKYTGGEWMELPSPGTGYSPAMCLHNDVPYVVFVNTAFSKANVVYYPDESLVSLGSVDCTEGELNIKSDGTNLYFSCLADRNHLTVYSISSSTIILEGTVTDTADIYNHTMTVFNNEPVVAYYPFSWSVKSPKAQVVQLIDGSAVPLGESSNITSSQCLEADAHSIYLFSGNGVNEPILKIFTGTETTEYTLTGVTGYTDLSLSASDGKVAVGLVENESPNDCLVYYLDGGTLKPLYGSISSSMQSSRVMISGSKVYAVTAAIDDLGMAGAIYYNNWPVAPITKPSVTVLSFDSATEKAEIKTELPPDLTAKLIIAAFSDGRLISSTVESCPSGSATHRYAIPGSSDADTVKAFLTDGDYKPICLSSVK